MPAQRLVKLHRYNGWNLVFLLISGALLWAPGLRGSLALVRTPLKLLHIASGLLSVALLAAYLPAARGHWERLGRRAGQEANVPLVAGLLIGWAATGAALWFNRYLPAGAAEFALLWHDRLTWFAIPWVIAHSATRYFKVKLLAVTAPSADRRVFLAGAATVMGAIAWGRLGRVFGLPGFDPPAGRGNGFAPGHLPLENGAPVQPQLMSTAEVPKGGGFKGQFRAYTVTDAMPAFDPATWRFSVTGLVERPLDLSWEEFLTLPRTEQVSDYHCVTGWSVYNCTWTGVRLADLLERAGVKPLAAHVKFISADGEYTDAVPLDVALRDDVMLPYLLDGRPLPTPLGGPVRLVIPKMYAYKSVKWVQAIALIEKPHAGYWEVRGYPADAWLRKG